MTPLELALELLRLPDDMLNVELEITRSGSRRKLKVISVNVALPEGRSGNWNSTRRPRIFLVWKEEEKT